MMRGLVLSGGVVRGVLVVGVLEHISLGDSLDFNERKKNNIATAGYKLAAHSGW
jgi:predicted acylesterase/phospholipase RssA